MPIQVIDGVLYYVAYYAVEMYKCIKKLLQCWKLPYYQRTHWIVYHGPPSFPIYTGRWINCSFHTYIDYVLLLFFIHICIALLLRQVVSIINYPPKCSQSATQT